MRNKKKAILFTAQSSKIGFLIYNHGNTMEEEEKAINLYLGVFLN